MFVTTQAAGPGRVSTPHYCNRHGSSAGLRTLMVAGLRGDDLTGVQLLGALNQELLRLSQTQALPGEVEIYPAIGPGGLDGLGQQTPQSHALSAEAAAARSLLPAALGARMLVHLRGPDGPMAVSPYARILSARRGALIGALGEVNLSGVAVVERFDEGSFAAEIEAGGVPTVEIFVGREPQPPSEIRGFVRGLAALAFMGEGLSPDPAWPEPPELLTVEQDGILTLRAEAQALFSPAPLLGVDLHRDSPVGHLTCPITGAVSKAPVAMLGARVLAIRHAGLVRPGDALALLAWPMDW